jgi:hypothetical protein
VERWCAKETYSKNDDLSTIADGTLYIISNTNLIGVNQDPGAIPATCFVGCDGDYIEWSAYATIVSGGDTVVITVNWKDSELTIVTFCGQDVGVIPSDSQMVQVTDLLVDQRRVGNV